MGASRLVGCGVQASEPLACRGWGLKARRYVAPSSTSRAIPLTRSTHLSCRFRATSRQSAIQSVTLAPVPSYTRLDEGLILETIEALRNRIAEKFPEAGLR